MKSLYCYIRVDLIGYDEMGEDISINGLHNYTGVIGAVQNGVNIFYIPI